MFRFLPMTEPDEIPMRVGKTVQWFRYTLFAANTVPAAEGTVGSGLPLTTSTVSATVSEYADFVTISTLLEETAIDPITQNAAEQLGYRAGLSVDTITRNEFDANVSSVSLTTLGAYTSAADFRRIVALLRAGNVRPKAGDEFYGTIHPYIVYDLQADNTAGGFIDLTKYGENGSGKHMKEGYDSLGEGIVGSVGGVLLKTSTNVTTSGSAPNVLYYTYVTGKGAIGSVDLAGRGPSRIENPANQSFKINTVRGGPQIADPAGMIGAAVSYRFVYVAKTLDTSTYRYRILTADASLV
jgi:N4-gp56 family major capsid protein